MKSSMLKVSIILIIALLILGNTHVSPAQVLNIPDSSDLRAYKSTALTPVEIEEIDFPVLSIILPDTAYESETFQGIIRIDQPLFFGSFFQLMVNPANVVIEPEFILMPAGLTETTCDLAIHGVDITQTISITPAEESWTSYSDTIEIIPAMFPESERQALIDLYYSTYGSHWNRSDNWLGERGTECSWSGVICDDYNLHVTYIVLENNNLNGEIPDTISNLQSLSELILTNNQLRRLPENFGNLQNLSLLELSVNQLRILPENFGNLQNLVGVNLSDNQLRRLPESFTNLHFSENSYHFPSLDLSNNQLSSLPDSFGNFQVLHSLYLSDNQLSSLPDSFGSFQMLRELDLSNNQLTHLPESFGNLLNLSNIYLSNNQLSSLPDNFSNFQNLDKVDLSDNQLRSLPEHFGNIRFPVKPGFVGHYPFLDLSNNQLISLPDSFGNIQYIDKLYLSNNQLESLPENFGNIQQLKVLHLSNNQLSSLVDSFENFQYMTYLHLDHNQLVSLPENFGGIRSLQVLMLQNNQLNRLPDSFGTLQDLSNLNLYNNKLSSLPENFGNLQNLEELILSNNQLIKLPENFTELDKADEGQNKSKLDYLDLSINQLENLPQNFERLKYISYLDISANHIKNIPSNIGDLPKLTYFSIANNDIEIIPESLGKCTNVSTLNLSYNHLKIIPSSLGNLKRLQYFDTSNNKIEELPETLKYLSNLQTIDLSNNEIQAFPYYLSHIKNLQELYLSDNNIGEINDDIQNFTHLLKLNLSGNSYLGGGGVNDTGHCHDCISSKIGMLENLQFLDISGCRLTSPVIPEELFHLNNLSYLSLSDNQLGVIPEHIANLKNLVSLSLAKNFISKLDKSVCNLLNLESLDVSGNKWLNGDIPLEFSKLTHLVFFDSDDTKLYTTSPALEKFITEISPEWINEPPPLTERQDLCISFITTKSDHLAYSKGAEIPILIVMTQPVRLIDGDLIITLETGETDQEVYVSPFPLSCTATANYIVQEGDFTEDLNVKSIKLTDGASLTNEYGENADLTLIPEINLADMKNIYVDGTIPSIEITSPSKLCVEDIDKIKGTVSDISKDFSVELAILDNQHNEEFHEIINYFRNTTESWEFEPTIEWKNQEYQIIVKATDFAGNTNTKELNFSFGKKPSAINCNISKSEITYGELFTISGQIMPIHNLSNQPVNITLITPEGDDESVSTSVNQNGQFSYHLKCHDITMHGQWIIKTSWNGNDCLLGATSNSNDLTVHRAKTEIFLDLTSDAVKVGDPFSIGGIFEPSPACKGSDLSGKEILLSIGNKNEYIKTNDSVGHFQLKDYDQLNIPGSYTVKAAVLQDDTYEGSDNVDMTINILEASGYAIIVQGQIPSGEGTESYSKTTMFVREQLENRGIQDNEDFNDIMYFNADDNHPKVDAKPDKEKIQEAIVEWASDNMNQRPGNLYIVMVDHGLPDQFFIDPDVITAQELNLWLDELQDRLKPQALEQHIVLILGFCHSGSFIDDVSGFHRIVIASAAADEFSYKGPLDSDNVREGEFFVAEFFKKIAWGKTIRESFIEAVDLTEQFTQSTGMGSINAPPYFDRSEQHPLLDDNGDKIGSNNLLESATDGIATYDFVIGVSTVNHNNPGDVVLTSVAPTIFLDDEDQFPDEYLWAKVSNDKNVLSIWIEIKAPEYHVEGSESAQKELIPPKIISNDLNDETKRYEWHWDDILSKEDFSLPGLYQVFYFAKDRKTKNVAPFMETKVYRNTPENKWPSEFQLISPADDSVLTTKGVITYCEAESDADCYTLFSWTGSHDPDNDALTYSIILSKNDETFSGSPTIINAESQTVYPIDLSESWKKETVYWKVRAVDPTGGRFETEARKIKFDNFGNPPVGRVKGYVCDAETGEILPRAKLQMEGLDVRLVRGYYLVAKMPVAYPFQASCEGYITNKGSVQFVIDKTILHPIPMQPTFLLGDIDGSDQVDLNDAILALKIMGNIEIFYNLNMNADVDGDGKIGKAEVIYILMETGGI